ncbi:MAG: hypothetical protein ABEJ42_02415 [Halobacteriaceae archaeon]
MSSESTSDARVSHEGLVRSCRATLGDELRSVVHFTSDGYEQVYLREDLDAGADLATFVENERVGFGRQRTDLESELGDYGYTIHGFANGYLVRVIEGDHGVFVTTDPLSMTRFREVVDAVRTVLDGA